MNSVVYDAEGSGFSLDMSCEPMDSLLMFPATCYKEFNPTVSMLVIYRDGVLVVQPDKSKTGEKKSWILPQSPIVKIHNLHEAVAICFQQELGLHIMVPDIKFCQDEVRKFEILGSYYNTIRLPSNLPKYIVAVGVVLEEVPKVHLDKQNSQYTFASNPYQLWDLMQNTRPVKVLGTFHSINRAHQLGLLPWSCADVLPLYLESISKKVIAA